MPETTYPITFHDTIWTYQDYLQLPMDGKMYQVIEGVLLMTPAPSSHHQEISRNLEYLLWEFVKKHRLGKVFYAPIDVFLTHTDIVQPDIAFIAKDKLNLVRKEGIFGPPDLVVEIISPSSCKTDEVSKRSLYERHGVYEYLLVYPDEKKVVQYAIDGGCYKHMGTYPAQDVLHFKSIPLAIPLGEVFTTEI